MIQNMGKLAGRTVFITGASRGIGKAIALKCAKDGANVVIAAKTAVPHPKLPGTIFTVATEVEAAGGQCLPCEVDIRDEEQVKRAVEAAVKKFGGIDILVNNASAISLTGTIDTPMKKVDLMLGVNMRGTYLCSKYCAPHLKKGKNPHILNIAPPLSMEPKWFQNHTAYTMAKYGMSMCTLGMSAEFKGDGIAVNSLWPRTAIYTAAMEMLGGGTEVKNQCRSPDIMSDAAYVIFTRDSRSYTGNFAIDDDVLRQEGITNFRAYNYVDKPQLLLDFFLEPDPNDSDFTPLAPIATAPPSSAATSAVDPRLAKTVAAIQGLVNDELIKSIGGVFLFDINDASPLYLDLKTPPGRVTIGGVPSGGKADVTMALNLQNFTQMFSGQLNPTTAYMSGKLKIKGDLGLAMKLEKLLKHTQSKL